MIPPNHKGTWECNPASCLESRLQPLGGPEEVRQGSHPRLGGRGRDKKGSVYPNVHKDEECLSFKWRRVPAYTSVGVPAIWGHIASMTRARGSCFPFQKCRIQSQEQV